MIKTKLYTIDLIEESEILWKYTTIDSGRSYEIEAPVFEIDGQEITASLSDIEKIKTRQPGNEVVEYVYRGELEADRLLALEIYFRIVEANPVVRFKYCLKAEKEIALTKNSGSDNLTYGGLKFGRNKKYKEVQLSQFREDIHSFTLEENQIHNRDFENKLSVMGPIFISGDEEDTSFLAYEHGSQVPDAYVHFQLSKEYRVEMEAKKGNYYDGQKINSDGEYETIWLQFGAVNGDEDYLADKYREYVLKFMSVNRESRKPYIFYNTWNYQERNKWWNDKTFLASMNEERILKEIDVAHKMGIEVFVIDTGWYQKTGDWQVNTDKFSEDLKNVRDKLDEYNMKLGLWFDPTAAAVSSQMLQEHKDCIMTRGGEKPDPHPIWETEESYNMCLVSRYHEAFAEELIRLIKEVGVTYFKWDAISQYGCDDPHHWHGNENNTPEERANCFSFELVRYMNKVVNRVCEECPEAIIDFDVTEGGRSFGLSFLSAGKYFLMNNGPYFANYDMPTPEDDWINMLVYPGPARAWNCRKPLTFDKWIPSVLFLTHYLPDDPKNSQIINIASLILGQNGIWGDLLDISDEGVDRFNNILSRYKEVRNDITESSPVRSGVISAGSPEIHEKISAETGRGAVVIFVNNHLSGSYEYVTENPVDTGYTVVGEGIDVEFDDKGRANLEFEFRQPGAKIVFFGT